MREDESSPAGDPRWVSRGMLQAGERTGTVLCRRKTAAESIHPFSRPGSSRYDETLLKLAKAQSTACRSGGLTSTLRDQSRNWHHAVHIVRQGPLPCFSEGLMDEWSLPLSKRSSAPVMAVFTHT